MDLHPSGLPGLVGPAEVSTIPPSPSPSPSPLLPHNPCPLPSDPAGAGAGSFRLLPNNTTTDLPRSDHESLLISRAISHPLHLKPSAAPPPPLTALPLPSLRLGHPYSKPGSLLPASPPPALDFGPTNPLFINHPLQPQPFGETKRVLLPDADADAIPPNASRESRDSTLKLG